MSNVHIDVCYKLLHCKNQIKHEYFVGYNISVCMSENQNSKLCKIVIRFRDYTLCCEIKFFLTNVHFPICTLVKCAYRMHILLIRMLL